MNINSDAPSKSANNMDIAFGTNIQSHNSCKQNVSIYVCNITKCVLNSYIYIQMPVACPNPCTTFHLFTVHNSTTENHAPKTKTQHAHHTSKIKVSFVQLWWGWWCHLSTLQKRTPRTLSGSEMWEMLQMGMQNMHQTGWCRVQDDDQEEGPPLVLRGMWGICSTGRPEWCYDRGTMSGIPYQVRRQTQQSLRNTLT